VIIAAAEKKQIGRDVAMRPIRFESMGAKNVAVLLRSGPPVSPLERYSEEKG